MQIHPFVAFSADAMYFERASDQQLLEAVKQKKRIICLFEPLNIGKTVALRRLVAELEQQSGTVAAYVNLDSVGSSQNISRFFNSFYRSVFRALRLPEDLLEEAIKKDKQNGKVMRFFEWLTSPFFRLIKRVPMINERRINRNRVQRHRVLQSALESACKAVYKGKKMVLCIDSMQQIYSTQQNKSLCDDFLKAMLEIQSIQLVLAGSIKSWSDMILDSGQGVEIQLEAMTPEEMAKAVEPFYDQDACAYNHLAEGLLKITGGNPRLLKAFLRLMCWKRDKERPLTEHDIKSSTTYFCAHYKLSFNTETFVIEAYNEGPWESDPYALDPWLHAQNPLQFLQTIGFLDGSGNIKGELYRGFYETSDQRKVLQKFGVTF